tara:strand:+ start:336 stop:611 length:276 start_codon:yes stop_codon:yes gene_type:complete
MNKVTLSREPVVKTIPMNEMEVGTFAEITHSPSREGIGSIVFRDMYNITVVGDKEGDLWSGRISPDNRVRPLEKGETITIVIGGGGIKCHT